MIAGCTSKPKAEMPQNEASDQFQTFTLSNAAGMKVNITPVGGHVMSIQLPDKNGGLTDVVLGYDSRQRLCRRQSDSMGQQSVATATASP